jgi:genome maintenance exonuclease 1
MFKHIDIELPKLERTTIDGVRYYEVPDNEELLKLVSITSVTSHKNRQIFVKWRNFLSSYSRFLSQLSIV